MKGVVHIYNKVIKRNRIKGEDGKAYFLFDADINNEVLYKGDEVEFSPDINTNIIKRVHDIIHHEKNKHRR